MSDDLDPRPHYPLDAEQIRLRLAWARREADEEQVIDRLSVEIAEIKGPFFEEIGRKQGLHHKDDLQLLVEAMARNAAIDQARTTIRHETIDVTQLADDLIEKRDLINEQQFDQAQAQRAIETEQRDQAQRDREARTAAATAEPIPGSVAHFDAALAERAEQRHDQWLGQKQRLNNADMDRLAEHGPQRPNYGLLRQSAEDTQIVPLAGGQPSPAPMPSSAPAAPFRVNGAPLSSAAFTITQAPAIDQWQAMHRNAPSHQAIQPAQPSGLSAQAAAADARPWEKAAREVLAAVRQQKEKRDLADGQDIISRQPNETSRSTSHRTGPKR